MRKTLVWGGGALLGALLALFLTLFPGVPPEALAQNVPCYMQQGGAVWVASDGCRWEVRSAGEMEVQSGGVVDIQSGADFSFSDPLNFTPSATQTVTMNDAITVDGPTTLLSSAGVVNTSNVACGEHGDIVLYVNVGSNNIVLTDTGTLRLSGNTTLGQYDNLTLHNVWGNCLEIAQVDN